MEGVTTAIVGFILACVIWPKLVKNKPQFYSAFAMVIVIILLNSLRIMLHDSAGFGVFAGAFTGIFQACALVLLVLSAGGISMRELSDDLKDAYEVIRRGETEKEIIVPIRGEMPKPKPEVARPPIPLDEKQ
jgi:hypothetical protein